MTDLLAEKLQLLCVFLCDPRDPGGEAFPSVPTPR
jgi:hypothetical protein